MNCKILKPILPRKILIFLGKTVPWFILFTATSLVAEATAPTSLPSDSLGKIRFEQRLGDRISLDLPFRDEHGKEIRLGIFFGGKPVILVLGYYGCPMLCGLVENGLVESLQDLQWNVGEQFEIVYVSIDPTETPQLAAAKKRSCLRLYGRKETCDGWHFLVGDGSSTRYLANQVGFGYAYDPSVHQYAHPSGIVILTPSGHVAAYFFGITYPAKELHQALARASKEQWGSRIREWVLLCFHYNPLTGRYSSLVINGLRGASILTVGILAGGILLSIRRERLRRSRSKEVTPAP